MKKPARPTRRTEKLMRRASVVRGRAELVAQKRSLATKIQRQPFAPFQSGLSVLPIVAGPPDAAPFQHSNPVAAELTFVQHRRESVCECQNRNTSIGGLTTC